MKTNLNRTLCSALPFILGLGLAGLVSAAKPPPPPPEPPPPAESGVLRVSSGAGYQLMSPTGGGADLTPAPAWYQGELSGMIAGHRWFLQLKPTAGFYPDGGPRYAVVAVSLDGTTEVTINDELLLQPIFWGEDYSLSDAYDRVMIRLIGAGGVSWLARPYDDSGEVIENEIGIFAAQFQLSDDGQLVAGPTFRVPVQVPVTNAPPDFGGLWARPLGYDWAPDGSALVFSNGLQLLWVNADGTPGPILQSASLTFRGPRWSPTGAAIVFSTSAGIESVAANATGWKRLTASGRGETFTSPAWSPSGNTVVFGYQYTAKLPYRFDIYSVPAAGGTKTNLSGATAVVLATPRWEIH